MAQERFQSVSAAAFALLALLLAAGGLAGTVARTVSERTRELALRAALGAGPRQLVSRVMGQGLRPVATGVAAGLCGAVALSRLIEGFLFEVSPLDPLAYAAAAATLAGTAAIACYLPARRALLVDPAVALRAE